MKLLDRFNSSLCKLSGPNLSSSAFNFTSEGFRQIQGAFVDPTTPNYRQRYNRSKELLAKIVILRSQIKKGGGEKAIQRQRKKQKLLVREKLQLILDRHAPFMQIGELAGHNDSLPGPGAGVITGIGRINNRWAVVTGQDSSLKSGAIYPMSLTKQLRAQRLSAILGLPTVNLVDSGGAFLPLQAEIFNRGGNIFKNIAVLQAYNNSPQIAVVVGDCVAGGAYSPTMSDHALMVHKMGTLFLGGPALVRAATGEIISAEELGGATTHCKVSGTTDYFVESEKKAYNHVRDLMMVVRQSEKRLVPFTWKDNYNTQPIYSSYDLKGLVGKHITPKDKSLAYCILARILDRSELCEFRSMYSTSLVCGWGRIAGKVVGLLASTGLPINKQSAESACQLVQICNDAKLPLICLQQSLHQGWSAYNHMQDALKAHAQLLAALATTNSHKITLNIGDCFGPDYWLTGAPSLEATYHLSYPTSRVAYSPEYLANESELSLESAFIQTDIIVDPPETRETLINCLKTLPLNQKASGLDFVMIKL